MQIFYCKAFLVMVFLAAGLRFPARADTALLVQHTAAVAAPDSADLLSPPLPDAVTRQPYIIGISSLQGFIIAHTPKMKHLAVTHPAGAELNLQIKTTGTQPWHQLYKYPTIGVSFIVFDYHNPVMGQSYALSTYINKNFYRTPKQEINFRIGTGLAYFTNKFDIRENHKNTIVSSAVNAVLQTRFEYDLMLSRKISLMASLGLNHYSNGATSKPNLGINIPTASLGLNYHANRYFKPAVLDLPPFRPASFWNISTSLGYKQFSESNPKKYMVNAISVLAGRQVNRKSNWLAGVEGFYDRSLLQYRFSDTSFTNTAFPDVKRAGVMVGHELLFGQLAFVAHLGVYFYRPYKNVDTFYYERLGLKYHFTELLFGSVDLKIHRGAADVIEWKVGVRL